MLLLAFKHPYVGRRLLIMVPTMAIISIITFAIIQIPPGNYLTTYIEQLKHKGEELSAGEVADLETISTSKHERIALRGTIREVRRTTSTSSYVEVHLQGTESVPALVAHLPVHRFLKAVGRPVTFRGDGSGTGFRVREVEGARVELETTLKDVSVASSGALLLQVPATQKGNGFRFLLAQ